jgi:hypothetical protein
MKSAAQRIARYNLRMLSSLLDPTLSSMIALATANFATYANDFVPKQEGLRVILNGLGVPHVHWAGYEAFHGELYKLSKQYSGAGAIAYATTLIDKWITVGAGALVEANLKTIADDLYGIVVP